MPDALTAIPRSHLMNIIPNGWEDALHTAWKVERSRVTIKKTRKRAPINAATVEMRNRIVATATRAMRAHHIAQSVGIKPQSIEYHLTALCAEGKLEKRVTNHKAYFRAVSS